MDYSHAAAAVTVDLSVTGAQAGAGNDILINIENLRGSAFDDHLTGDNSPTGNVLEGGPGDDTLDGGGGSPDTVSYEHATGPVTVDLSSILQQDTISAGLDTISNFENVLGSAYADTLTGNGNSVLEGGLGADHLIGQSGGSDTASYQHATSGVTANLNPSPISDANTGDAAVGDTYTNIANLLGSQFNDSLIGDDNPNMLNGNGTHDQSSDILTGNGGADTFVFGGGNVTVTDFSHAQVDQIDLSNLNFGAGIVDFSALLPMINAAGHGDVLDFGNGNVLTLTNIDVSTLQSNDFILHHI